MLVLALVALMLAGLAIRLLIWGVVLPRVHVTARVEQISTYGFARESITDVMPRQHDSPFADLARRIGATVAARCAGYEEWVHDQLLAAGIYRVSSRMFMGYQAI